MIEIKSVSKTYGEKDDIFVLKDINLSLKKNSLTLIKGVSGSGKSTLLSIIAGFSRPSFGETVIFGERVSKLPENHLAHFRKKHIGFVFQSFALIEDISVYENVKVPLINEKLDSKVVHKMVIEALQKAHILHKKDSIVFGLSGGEKQRCAIARALVNNPEIFIADEPTANLDRESSERFLELLGEIKNSGKTIIVATHDDIFDTLFEKSGIINLKNGTINEHISLK